MSNSSHPAPLAPSELGTKEYWDALYTRETQNHVADPSDEGTVWFDDSDAQEKMISLLRSAELGIDREKAGFLELGTGNGALLVGLREGGGGDNDDDDDDDEERGNKDSRGFQGPMLGTDYSPSSIHLASRIASTRPFSTTHPIAFQTWDILSSPVSSVLYGTQAEGWDVVLDKGTFDAVSLSGEEGVGGRYVQRVRGLVRRGGVVVVTSCNWTEGELRGWFEGGGEGDGEDRDGGRLEFGGRVEYPRFSFGGREGQTICTCYFRRTR